MKIGVYSFRIGKEPKDLINEIRILKKQLNIALNCLNFLDSGKLIFKVDDGSQLEFNGSFNCKLPVRKALDEIKEVGKWF